MNTREAEADRRARIFDMRQAGLAYAEIGRRLGISRERVRQIHSYNNGNRRTRASKVSPWLTTGDVARLVNIHTNTVRRWTNNGILKAYRLGPRGDRRFRRADINRLFREGIAE